MLFKEAMGYRNLIERKRAEFRLLGWPEEKLPEAVFEPEILRIRIKKGQKPIHVTYRWGSRVKCGNVDVKWLIEYLRSKRRDCHVNTGVHGDLVNDKFEWAWQENGGDQLRQDVESAISPETKVSFHMVTRKYLPCYHAGVDTIDGFCYSFHKKLTEEELDEVCQDFLVKEQKPSDPVQQDEKNTATELQLN